jgi:uncharacterized protein YjdB
MKHVTLTPAILCLLLAAGCGGGGSGPNSALPTISDQSLESSAGGRAEGISVSVRPEALTLQIGRSETFTATVSGTDNKRVVWSVQEGAAGGSITDGGRYTAPNKPGIYHVIARSRANLDKKAVATVTVKGPEQSAISISVRPTALTLFTGRSETFTATVLGTDNKAVIWSVQEGPAGGSITDGGRYTAPSIPGTYHVVVTSKANPDKRAVATVTVNAAPTTEVTVSIQPAALTLLIGRSETFRATVTGTDNKSVIWSIQEREGAGSITDAGRYTAPIRPGIYHIVATSKANTAKKAVATVTVKAAL